MKRGWRIVAACLALAGALPGAFHARVAYLANRPLEASRVQAVDQADQYYFAYGSNMSLRYLGNVRGVRPVGSWAAELAGHEVAFLGPGLNGLEPAFAYLRAREGALAYGVLHRLSREDLERIKASEGARYEWSRLPVQLADGRQLLAHTLVRTTPGTPGTPSRRYLGILIEGAEENGLPAPYVSRLRVQASVHVPVVSDLMGSALMLAVMKRSGTCDAWLIC